MTKVNIFQSTQGSRSFHREIANGELNIEMASADKQQDFTFPEFGKIRDDSERWNYFEELEKSEARGTDLTEKIINLTADMKEEFLKIKKIADTYKGQQNNNHYQNAKKEFFGLRMKYKRNDNLKLLLRAIYYEERKMEHLKTKIDEYDRLKGYRS